MKELIQRKVLNYRKFKLYPDRIEIETKESGKLTRYKVAIDEIGYNIIYQADKNILAKLVWYIFMAIPFFIIAMYFILDNPESLDLKTTIIVAGGFGIVAILGLLHPMQDDIILEGYRNITFYRDRPDEETVNNFIEEVIKTAKAYLRDKYIDLDEDITEEELSYKLKYLKEKNIITQEESDVILETFKDKRFFK